LKLDDIKGERVVGNTSLDNITLGGGLVVTGSAAQNLSHHKIKLDFHTIKLTNANIRSSVTIVDEDCDGRLDVSCAGPVDFSASSLAATDMFLKLDNVRGLSTGSNASLRELILFGGLSVTARDAAKMTITGVACDRYTIKLTNASLAGASVATDEDIACGDQISVSCTGPVDYSASSVRASDMFLKFDGIKGASFVDNTSLDRVTLSGGLFVSSRVVHKMSLDDIKGERIYLKLDAASAQGRSSVSLADVDLDGPVDVVCRGAVDFSAGGGGSSGLSSHAVDMHLKFESLATQTTPSSVTLRDWSLDGVLDIVSRGALNLSVGGATTNPDGSVSPGGGLRAVDMFLKIGDVKRAPESSKMSLTDLVLSGDLQVVMGGGDDSLSVSTSTVAGIAIFDGGKGNDNLVISGSAFGFEPVQISCAPV
jgi:hypothetical protein